MKSANNNSPRGPLLFPITGKANAASVIQKDKAATQAHFALIPELCRDTAMALQELRHGIANVLLDTLEKMSLDTNTLVYLLDEPPSVVRGLMDGDTTGLTTATMIEYLERLHGCSDR
jgi:hypothetical protein